MKHYYLFLSLLLWMVVTLLLCLSIVGLVVVLRSNYTGYWKSEEENRSGWMKIGMAILNKLLD